MTLSAGDRLGPYEIMAPIGAGGMGEVYRAMDPRLGREIAIKVISSSFLSDPDQMKRFEQEARMVGGLNHPNIVTLFDIGSYGESPYLVTELLQGRTLREGMSEGLLPISTVIGLSVQILNGLFAAHARGVVHRDLKPENLFITSDGRAKILDFGLAKLFQPPGRDSQRSGMATQPPPQTAEGYILGTAGYMSPEQARGRAVDARSDIFSFGSILYEMLWGERAFAGESTIEVLNAILTQVPVGLKNPPARVPSILSIIVEHCLEKEPENRFQTAADLAFSLQSLSGFTDTKATVGAGRAPMHATFHRITYSQGHIMTARFAPDGHTIVYGASWNGEPYRLYLSRTESLEAIRLNLPDADILSISSDGEMAISLGRKFDVGYTAKGTLARVKIIGGAPRQILEDIQDAEWIPGNVDPAIVRLVEGKYQLEFPLGHVVFQGEGWISRPRIAPDGKRVAFQEHPVLGDDKGAIAVVEESGQKRTLTSGWKTLGGLAWTPDGEEIWFAGAKESPDREIFAVDLSGRVRSVLTTPVTVTLHDISTGGKVLISRENLRRAISYVSAEEGERDLSWLNWSLPTSLSADGSTLVFVEQGPQVGGAALCIRKTDGSPVVQLAQGYAPFSLAPDGKSVLASTDDGGLAIIPVTAGATKTLTYPSMRVVWADWLPPDGTSILFSAVDSRGDTGLYLDPLTGAQPQRVHPETAPQFNLFMSHLISPDGNAVAGWDPQHNVIIQTLQDGKCRVVEGTNNEIPVHWDQDSSGLYVLEPWTLPAKVFHINLQNGERKLSRSIMPSDPSGVSAILPVLFTPDLSRCVYSYRRILSDLILIDGLM